MSWGGEDLPEATLCSLRSKCLCKASGAVHLVSTLILQMIGLQWAGNETELLPGMMREGRIGALGVAGVEIIFFMAAHMVLCFGILCCVLDL